MPSRARAKTVFFCASVVRTCALSPAVCAAAKSPRRAGLTFRPTIPCRGGGRRVLLRGGGEDVRVVARGVRRGEVAAQGGAHVQVDDPVPGGTAVDRDDADLRLAVLVRAEPGRPAGHGCA